MANRRKFLQLSASLLGAGALPTVLNNAIAQAGGNNSPRLALVIGNGNYKNSPLVNPPNDARAIAKTLTELDFSCNLLTDATLQEMVAAVKAHGEKLAQIKGVGLFYYAGHGAQLAWRNYLVPVDARIAALDDLPRQTLELNSLLQALKSAANPMNVIILDACRDNPFGASIPLEQKGLSQFDAPAGSLLAYATAPGNTASDGEGANGLFTENLLREMRVAGAKLEDVFKRVRLQVRLKSKGQQIPWESTSLEDDFYFTRMPEQVANISEDKAAALFAHELSVWEAIRESASPDQFADYLTRYPNGKFSQLAQIQLDQLLKKRGENKLKLASAAGNPYTKGSAEAVGNYSVGDSYTFELRDRLSRTPATTYRDEVTAIADNRVVFNHGALILDAIGNEILSHNPRFLTPAQLFAAEYSVGSKWSTQFGWRKGNGEESTMALDMKVVSRESFTTPAGTFNAFKVVGTGWVVRGSYWTITYWVDPQRCLRPLHFEMVTHPSGKRAHMVEEQIVLTSFSQKYSQA